MRFSQKLFASIRGAFAGFRSTRTESPAEAARDRPIPARLSLSGAMATDVGRVRPSNEDCVAFVAPDPGSPFAEKGFLAIVADGMGGHAAGEIASAIAVEVVRDEVYRSDKPAPLALAAAMEKANLAIRDHSRQHPETAGMGTTCTAILAREDALFLAHVGDSRAYIFRDNALHRLSEDQTLHEQMIRDGLMTREEAANRPGANFILQALGARDEIAPVIFAEGLPLRPGDRLLLCSDGLHGLVDDAAIASALALADAREACEKLIAAANEAGGQDNISVGVFHVEWRGADSPPPPAGPAQTRTMVAATPQPDAVDE
jgi:protein phosphatase